MRRFKRGEYFAWRRHVIARQDRWARRLDWALAAVFSLVLAAGCVWLEYLKLTGKL